MCYGFPYWLRDWNIPCFGYGWNQSSCLRDRIDRGEVAFDITQSKYRLPQELKTGHAEELWEYIADCLRQFLKTHHHGQMLDKLPLGFTFSYPVTQDYIDHGVLQRWTKGFDIAGVEGHDVVPMFEGALAKQVCQNDIDWYLHC